MIFPFLPFLLLLLYLICHLLFLEIRRLRRRLRGEVVEEDDEEYDWARLVSSVSYAYRKKEKNRERERGERDGASGVFMLWERKRSKCIHVHAENAGAIVAFGNKRHCGLCRGAATAIGKSALLSRL